jgi:serine/threonine protein kinase
LFLSFSCLFYFSDLKPDNIGFTAEGHFKLFDFGLVTCVKSRQSANDSYAMTGFTGSLRYMAPEVALCKPYTEKVDVYSFGILLWQMARDRIPFKGMNKEEFMKAVVNDNERPKLDSSWPVGFSSLLTSCWNKDPLKRPTFEAILKELDLLLNPGSAESPQHQQINKQSKATSFFGLTGSAVKHSGNSNGLNKEPVTTPTGLNLPLSRSKSEYSPSKGWF